MAMMKRVGKLSYDPQRIIGEGSGGTIVFYGIYHEEDVDKPVAVKRIQRLTNHADESAIQQEKKLMETTVNHVNILRYLWTERDDYFWFMATELCSGTLEEYLNGKYVGPRFLNELEILHQVVQGLAHLHRLGIVHRDIKPTNILIFIPSVGGDETINKPLVKLADFGISKILKIGKNDFTNTSVTNPNGTRGWMAPEVYESNRFAFKVDIFSLGCVFAYILTGGKHPFGDNVNERVLRISRKERMLVAKQDFRNGEAFKLIQSMLEMDPSKRPTAVDILNKCSFFLSNLDRTRKLLDLFGSFDLTDDKVTQIKQLINDPTVNIQAVLQNGWTPLHLLCLSYHRNKNWNTLVRLFIGKDIELNARDEEGLTPLHLLCTLKEIENQVVDVVFLLIEKGADVNVQDKYGRTPLYVLYRYYQKGNFKGTLHRLLVLQGADVNVKNDNGLTPLHCACRYCKIDSLNEIAQWFIEEGADENVKDQNGSTSLHELLGYYNYNYKNDALKNVVQLLI